jgi:CRP/FNR family transcriptional regulator, cyclic AMP receptor protein
MNRKAKLPFDPKEFLSKVNGGQRTSDYRKDQIVYRQGDPADAVFYIQNGRAKKTVVSEQGKEAVVALLGAGDFFGEGSIAGEPLRLATVSALTECTTILRINSMGGLIRSSESAFGPGRCHGRWSFPMS